MRVALDVTAVPDRPRGAGVYTVELARGLADPGAAAGPVDLVLVTRRDDAERWRRMAPHATVHAAAPTARPARLAWEQLGAPRLAKRLGVDVWHSPHYTTPLRASIPVVVTVHDLTFLEHPEWHERSKAWFFARMIPASTRRAAVCVCVSRHTAARLALAAPPAGPVVVIPHGVDHARFRADADERADRSLLAACGIAPPFVGFVGTIEPRKAVDLLVTAFAIVGRRRPDLRLVLAGSDGWGADRVGAVVAASGVADRVVRAGFLSDAALPAFLRRADVVAYPSHEEGFGLPALEAMACGAPLVTTRGSAMEEFVGDAAVLVPPGDVAALVDGLDAALDPATAARLRTDGPAHAASYTWAASVAAHVAAYERACSAP